MIFQKLLAHYENCREKIKNTTSLNIALMICRENSISYGICGCDAALFDEMYYTIFSNKLVDNNGNINKFSEYNCYIYKVPCRCKSVSEILETIDFRIKFLKNETLQNNIQER